MLCRYVNSQLPPLVISSSHAWVVVAYRRAPGDDRRVTLWRHDDARGRYLEVDDPFAEPEDAHRPWRTAILPLLPAIYVTAERAEAAGRLWFAGYLRGAEDDEPVARAAAAGELAFRTYVVRSDEYLEGLWARGVDPALADLYRLAALPEHLWVVEAVDRAAAATAVPTSSARPWWTRRRRRTTSRCRRASSPCTAVGWRTASGPTTARVASSCSPTRGTTARDGPGGADPGHADPGHADPTRRPPGACPRWPGRRR
ncbi:hypothetical protein [Actinomycetospora chibensis]|uniref:Uncharacterized protein n=1 Tax=Actinomycetospora chibensis TaxID=663606 RepID=A0ABV9RJ52_9PSEU|nr:hypothetical protein [Actinomycetospora chibensis]MDD7926225.1 hypothetical protein [Actinomycetospora chibensis]